MKTVRGYAVCDGCKYSQFHFCTKFNEACPSVMFGAKQYQFICSACKQNDGYEFGILNTESSSQEITTYAYMHMPGIRYFDLFKTFILKQKLHPEVFYPNRKISEVYGSFPGTVWNGRTLDFGIPTMSLQQADSIRQEAEALGISINLTWNNHVVSGTDVYDRYCNAITEIFHNGKHAITVASLDLFHYLKEKYPNFKYYQSVISTTNDTVFTKKDEAFDMYLMNRNLNNNWDELLKIPLEERNKIEFLCNDACTPICQRMVHYDIVNDCLLNRSGDSETRVRNYCTIDHDFIHHNLELWPITITTDHIDEYLKHGFQHFKLCSRDDNKSILTLKMAKYLAKPQYVEDVFAWGILNIRDSESERKSRL